MDYQSRRSVILRHYENPNNRGLIDSDEYTKIRINHDSCIDEINLMVKVVGDKIIDIRFDGEACAICTSATSIMISLLIDKTFEEASVILVNYKKMIEGMEYNASLLGDAIAYEDIAKQPHRKTCALIPWLGIEKIVGDCPVGHRDQICTNCTVDIQ